MRALVIDRPDEISVVEAPAPCFGADEVLIDVLAGGICGTDVEIVHGTMEYFTNGSATYPIVPCHEWTGVVRAVGATVSSVAPGDRVVGECSIGCLRCSVCLAGQYHRCPHRTETGILNRQGAFAEQICLPAPFVHRISSGIGLRAAALIEPTTIAYSGVKRAGVSPSDRVAIFGDGPIGLLLLQVSRLFGAYRVALIGAADQRLALAKSLGADLVIDARREDVVARLTGFGDGALPDVVFEASGNPIAVKAAIAATTPGGRLVLQGFCGAKRIDNLDIDPIIVNDITLIGAQGSPSVWPAVIRLVEDGRLDPAAIVTDELPVSAFSEAISRVENRSAVKVVLRTDSAQAWDGS